MLDSRLEAVERDEDDIARQVAVGEFDDGVGQSLRAVLADERAALSEALKTISDAPDTEPAASARRSRRALFGTAAVVLGAAVVTLTLVATTDGGGGGGIVDAPPIDPASVTSEQLEAVVAANPEIIGMRLALAHRLFDEGNLLGAATHFNEVLQREPNPEAMAWLGWISYIAGEFQQAEGFITDALTLVPDYGTAHWFLANVRLYGLDDPARAIEPLELLLSSPGVPDPILIEAQLMLAEARQRLNDE